MPRPRRLPPRHPLHGLLTTPSPAPRRLTPEAAFFFEISCRIYGIFGGDASGRSKSLKSDPATPGNQESRRYCRFGCTHDGFHPPSWRQGNFPASIDLRRREQHIILTIYFNFTTIKIRFYLFTMPGGFPRRSTKMPNETGFGTCNVPTTHYGNSSVFILVLDEKSFRPRDVGESPSHLVLGVIVVTVKPLFNMLPYFCREPYM